MEPRQVGRFLSLLIALTLPASAVDWTALEKYQGQITRGEFDRLLREVYCPSGALTNHLAYSTNSVVLFPSFTLRFAPAPASNPAPVSIRSICLDPGHIGGEWARMEERWFQRGQDRPIQEAVLNLTVARLLKSRLEAIGFHVTLSKDNYWPVTAQRPEDFRAQVESETPPSDDEANRGDAVRRRMEHLFYRSSEIAARARRINEDLKPDLTL